MGTVSFTYKIIIWNLLTAIFFFLKVREVQKAFSLAGSLPMRPTLTPKLITRSCIRSLEQLRHQPVIWYMGCRCTSFGLIHCTTQGRPPWVLPVCFRWFVLFISMFPCWECFLISFLHFKKCALFLFFFLKGDLERFTTYWFTT